MQALDAIGNAIGQVMTGLVKSQVVCGLVFVIIVVVVAVHEQYNIHKRRKGK